jgi:hypothetical protein
MDVDLDLLPLTDEEMTWLSDDTEVEPLMVGSVACGEWPRLAGEQPVAVAKGPTPLTLGSPVEVQPSEQAVVVEGSAANEQTPGGPPVARVQTRVTDLPGDLVGGAGPAPMVLDGPAEARPVEAGPVVAPVAGEKVSGGPVTSEGTSARSSLAHEPSFAVRSMTAYSEVLRA